MGLLNEESVLKKSIKVADVELDAKLLEFYPTLSEIQVKQLVVDDKWLLAIDKEIHSEMDRLSQRLTKRVNGLAERYETPMPVLGRTVTDLESVVSSHLKKMGFVWS